MVFGGRRAQKHICLSPQWLKIQFSRLTRLLWQLTAGRFLLRRLLMDKKKHRRTDKKQAELEEQQKALLDAIEAQARAQTLTSQAVDPASAPPGLSVDLASAVSQGRTDLPFTKEQEEFRAELSSPTTQRVHLQDLLRQVTTAVPHLPKPQPDETPEKCCATQPWCSFKSFVKAVIYTTPENRKRFVQNTTRCRQLALQLASRLVWCAMYRNLPLVTLACLHVCLLNTDLRIYLSPMCDGSWWGAFEFASTPMWSKCSGGRVPKGQIPTLACNLWNWIQSGSVNWTVLIIECF